MPSFNLSPSSVDLDHIQDRRNLSQGHTTSTTSSGPTTVETKQGFLSSDQTLITSPAELAAHPIGSSVLARELVDEIGFRERLVKDRVLDFIMDNQVIINTFIAGGWWIFFSRQTKLCADDSTQGGLAGAASRTVVSPLERLKIIL